MRRFVIASSAAIVAAALMAEKKMLDHQSFDDWKSVVNHALSSDGKWGAYSVNPQEGDGIMTFYSTNGNKRIEIPRGYRPTFSSDGKWGIALIKPLYSETRAAKIQEKATHEMPVDSLAIVDLLSGKIEKIGNVTGYKIGKKGGEWVAYTSVDTTLVSRESLGNEETGRPMVVRRFRGGESRTLKWVKGYNFSNDGQKLTVNIRKEDEDTLSTDGVGVLYLPEDSFVLIDRDKEFYSTPVFDESGMQLAYTASTDTVETGTLKASVYYAKLSNPMKSPKEFPLELKSSQGEILTPNQYTEPKFSFDGRRLIGGVARVVAPDDTTKYSFETPQLDIWRWDSPYTPPQEKHRLKEEQTRNFPVVIDLQTDRTLLVTDNPLAEVVAPNRWDGNNVLILDPSQEIISQQWNYFADVEMQNLDLLTGESKEIGKCYADDGSLSPGGRYAVWFRDKHYYTYDMQTGRTYNVSEKMPYPVWDDSDDHPSPAVPFGDVFWSENDDRLLVYDRYDIWALDPKGEANPVCVTGEAGRKQNLKLRYHNTDDERRFVSPGEVILLDVFDYTDKYNGLATLKYNKKGGTPAIDMLNEYAYTQVRKAKDAYVYSWQRANFSTSPDIWLSRGAKFLNAEQLTDANPQMKEYRWGTARLVKWTAYDGKESEGVLYVPDDMDPTKKYPMLCVFYETGSEDLYRHYTMEPSWSWVNYPFYVSRGYVIFVPDIHYTPGIPGESCYNYVCSGAEEMCRRYPWIDKERIGIDGQSWGGYQTAYLVTRTNMFACAGSGAPVSNMTSAFGGIRWESGDSRQAQYEVGQSRIGRNLWEAPELYIYNSPVFHANKVETPLLIMHNDGDGAVPWYQGIEMFMALRRLQKPVWMLQYNGEAHNIKQRKNRKDITIRLQQFFDHYLKGDPMPRWMNEGLPMLRKGQDFNYELEK